MDHVWLIILENAGYPFPAPAPYLEDLISKYAFAADYYSVSEPSLPNYLALTGGSTFNVMDDLPPPSNVQPAAEKSIASLFDEKGLSWKGYMESMPTPCALADAYPYAAKHNPFVFYGSITQDKEYCASHVVDFVNLAADISANTLPNFAWITPDMRNDGHDTGITFADTWLNGFLTPVLAMGETMSDTVIFVVSDETNLPHASDTSCVSRMGGRVFCVAIGPPDLVKYGFASSRTYNHYSLLATIEKMFAIGNLGRCDASAMAMDDLLVG